MIKKHFNLAGGLREVERGGSRLVVWLSRRLARWLLFIFILGLAVWQGYVNAWMPLKQEASLPAGVLEDNPQLNVKLLRSINSQRNNRMTRERPSFQAWQSFFNIPSGEDIEI